MAKHAARVHAGHAHGAEGALERGMSGDPMGRIRGGSRALADPDLLAWRRRAAHHLGAHRHAGTAQDATESGHLSTAGDRAQQADHALAPPSRRRAGLSRPRAERSRRAVSDRGCIRCGSGNYPRRSHTGTGHALGVPIRGIAARCAHGDRSLLDARTAGSCDCGNRARGFHPGRRERRDRL